MISFLVIVLFLHRRRVLISITSPVIIAPACTLAALILIVKPVVFSWLLHRSGEVRSVSWEIGVRLGQMSEFSLLLIYMALETNIIASHSQRTWQKQLLLSRLLSLVTGR